MSKYSSALFGTLDISPFYPPSLNLNLFDYIRRPELKKVNEKGQVYASDNFINMTYHVLDSVSDNGLQAYDYAMQYYIQNTSDRPCAWFAMPAYYGNFPETAEGQTNEKRAWAIKYFHENPCFYYFLIADTKGASISQQYDNELPDGRFVKAYYKNQTFRTKGEYEYAEKPSVSSRDISATLSLTNDVNHQSYVSRIGLKGMLRNFVTYNGNNPDGRKWKSYSQEIDGWTSPLFIADLQAAFMAWESMENSIYNRLDVYIDGFVPAVPEGMPLIGSNLISDFPIFTLSSVNEMIKYFQGESWISDNNLPPSDWSTDWDIYIKGVQKPNIFITMKSDKVDNWLNGDKNTGGMKKEDIKVEYRYREHPKNDNLDNPSLWNLYEYTLKDYVKRNYNETLETDYVSNCDLNFLDFSHLMGTIFTAEGTIQNAYLYHAEMEFRLKYGEYRSAWCRYEVGVIGSPSVKDFAKMKNVGEQLQEQDIVDKSTVTLHYDEYPDGYDPYPTPPNPDMPPLQPTDPHPSEHGMGLLTQTYKISPANAKALGNFFWSGDLFQKIKALNTSPIENVVGLTIMPVNIDGASAVITIGDVDTNINGDIIDNIPIYDLGSIEIKGRYGNFLDFEPYTSMFLFLPFVGFVRIDPAYVTGKTLSLKYSFDLICGMCNAMLFVDGIYVESHQGHCGINIPLIATNRADLQIGLATSLLSTAATAALAPEALPAILGAGMDLSKASASYISGFHSDRQSGYNPTCAWTETRECYLVIESPNASYSATYAHDVGKPCLASMNIGSLSGFTQVESADLSEFSGATEEEKEMLMNILQTGFYA